MYRATLTTTTPANSNISSSSNNNSSSRISSSGRRASKSLSIALALTCRRRAASRTIRTTRVCCSKPRPMLLVRAVSSTVCQNRHSSGGGGDVVAFVALVVAIWASLPAACPLARREASRGICRRPPLSLPPLLLLLLLLPLLPLQLLRLLHDVSTPTKHVPLIPNRHTPTAAAVTLMTTMTADQMSTKSCRSSIIVACQTPRRAPAPMPVLPTRQCYVRAVQSRANDATRTPRALRLPCIVLQRNSSKRWATTHAVLVNRRRRLDLPRRRRLHRLQQLQLPHLTSVHTLYHNHHQLRIPNRNPIQQHHRH
mmetsp:Transcript_16338/g.28008  ORF Transcript_16338/g.28008 Transcript_16338/m.28008 type:complete len:311 (+) Transcript_16338:1674-2606(+)